MGLKMFSLSSGWGIETVVVSFFLKKGVNPLRVQLCSVIIMASGLLDLQCTRRYCGVMSLKRKGHGATRIIGS